MLKAGRARSIGVSNFSQKHLEQLLEDCTVKPMVNQIEKSPYRAQHELTKFCQSNDIFVQGWAPFGSGGTGVLKDGTIAALAKAHGNLDIYDFKLTKEEMASLDKLDGGLA